MGPCGSAAHKMGFGGARGGERRAGHARADGANKGGKGTRGQVRGASKAQSKQAKIPCPKNHHHPPTHPPTHPYPSTHTHPSTKEEEEELTLHQEELEGINDVLGQTCRELRILYLQNNALPIQTCFISFIIP